MLLTLFSRINHFFVFKFCLLYFVSISFYAVVNLLVLDYGQVFGSKKPAHKVLGGLKWTRTIDLTLIRRVL